eukprot:TRINITY_DN14208_c0_g3_i1.p1 TRINITY_DN14208_c0_g3~~TRINITY_DN14208_c0_g3_i1.p1  ORF type:complete len:463 (-),score=63.77 TRINITY_DN14208_c0_g3_i1:135-1523(-)
MLSKFASLLRDASLLVFVVMPGAFLIMSLVTAFIIAPVEGWSLLKAFGFAVSAATGGAIQLPGHSMAPISFISRFVAVMSGSACVGVFGFLVAAIGNLLPGSTDMAAKHPDGQFLRSMIELLLIVLCVFTIVAVGLGAELQFIEQQSFWLCFNTVFSAELGGGIPVDVLKGATDVSKAAIIVVSLWSIGLTGIVISLISDVFMSRFGSGEDQGGKDNAKSSRCRTLRAIAFVYTAVPLFIFFAMGLVATGGMVFFDDWLRMFWQALPTVTGGAAVVYPSPANLSRIEQLLMVGMSTLGFVIVNMGIALASSATSLVLANLGVQGSGANLKTASKDLLLALVVRIPIAVITCSVPLGFLLSVVEGWTFWEGLWWCVAAQLGGGMSLSNGTFRTVGGRAVGSLVAAWSVALTGFSVGLSSAPNVQPLIDCLTSRVHSCCGPSADGESSISEEADSEGGNSSASE